MIRIFDTIFSFLGLVILSPIVLCLLVIGYFDTGSPIFRQERVGLNKNPFFLLKFRSMNINTESMATHLVGPSVVTSWGSFLRKSKLDELPQLFNVLLGHMSFVGPRPNLFNQKELLFLRDNNGVYTVRPGITGLAQIKKIDMSTPELLVETDTKMIASMNIFNYFKYIFLTIFGKGFGDRINKNNEL